MQDYYVYILTNNSKTLYTGFTNDLRRRVGEHKKKLHAGFTAKYNVNKLIYFEYFSERKLAMEREKQIKGLLRSKKIDLINTINPEWNDLSKDWF
jgi:putative endonuclease